MTLVGDRAEIEFGSYTWDRWESYEIAHDLLTPANAWAVLVQLAGTPAQRREAQARVTRGGNRCFVRLARVDHLGAVGPFHLQLSGIIDTVAVSSTRNDGTSLRVSGRDTAGLLASASADPSLGVTSETTLREAVLALVEPFGVTVVTEAFPGRTLQTGAARRRESSALVADAARSYGVTGAAARRSLLRRRTVERGGPIVSGPATGTRAAGRAGAGHASGMTGSDVARLTLPEAKPQPGETVWDFIDRHCRRLGVLPWVDAEGRLVISSPDYDQEPMWTLTRGARGGNIVAGGYVRNSGATPSEVRVYGRAGGHDATRSPFRAIVSNPNQPFFRPLVVHDPSVRSVEEAERRARRELNRLRIEEFKLEYAVHGHGQGEMLYAIDTVADVDDEDIGISGLYYVVGVKFTGNRKEGSTTMLTMVPVGAIEL